MIDPGVKKWAEMFGVEISDTDTEEDVRLRIRNEFVRINQRIEREAKERYGLLWWHYLYAQQPPEEEETL